MMEASYLTDYDIKTTEKPRQIQERLAEGGGDQTFRLESRTLVLNQEIPDYSGGAEPVQFLSGTEMARSQEKQHTGQLGRPVSEWAGQIRIINRRASSNFSAEEIEKISEEKGNLIVKKYQGRLSRVQERRLRFLEWQLDRFEDSEIGGSLDALEALVENQEKSRHELKTFLKAVQEFRAKKR